MTTILRPCRVPWWVSPSTSGVTLIHAESDYRASCRIVFGGGRLGPDGRTDDRRIELMFRSCRHARAGPKTDLESIESIGYQVRPNFAGDMADYLDWLRREWQESGLCPNPGFFVAETSAWLDSLPEEEQIGRQHYVVEGRDGYAEVIARHFSWREWLWLDYRRDRNRLRLPVADQGVGVD